MYTCICVCTRVISPEMYMYTLGSHTCDTRVEGGERGRATAVTRPTVAGRQGHCTTVGLLLEFYKKAARDPTDAKLVMSALEQKYDMAPANDLDEAVSKLETHITTQLMKAVASLSATNTVWRTGKDCAAKEQYLRIVTAAAQARDAAASRCVAPLGCSRYLQRAIKFGIYEKPTVPFLEGEELAIIP